MYFEIDQFIILFKNLGIRNIFGILNNFMGMEHIHIHKYDIASHFNMQVFQDKHHFLICSQRYSLYTQHSLFLKCYDNNT
jgi:hypothetical protein